MITGTLTWARQEAVRLHRIRWAMLLLANVPAERLRAFNGFAQEEALRNARSQKVLKDAISKMKTEITGLREGYKIHAAESDLLSLLSEALAEDSDEPQLLYTLVSHLNERYLKHYEHLPAHARVGIDPHGSRPSPGFEYRLLEATLFEDMCALFNLARRQDVALGGRSFPKQAFKETQALLRATVSAAFYLVEGYLNGLAFDHIDRLGKAGPDGETSLRDEDVTLMTEWNFERNRAKFVNTRDKLLQYPRIILGLRDPPLQESNCPEMRLILERSKSIRDSIVHCSPFPRPTAGKEPVLNKEELLYSLSMPEAEEIVDATVGLVRKINDLLGGGKELGWLLGRGEDGFFPTKVFD